MNVGQLFAAFENTDDLVEQMRRRMEYIGASFGIVDALTELGEGSTTKYLSAVRTKKLTINSLLRVAGALGLKALLVVDEEATRRMARHWGSRDPLRVHTRPLPTLGAAQMKRVRGPVLSELGRRGGKARMRALTSEQRRELGLRGAEARWRRPAPPP